MDVDEAIRGRRTHKAYRPEPVPREVLGELFELARWAPNHNLTIPWRFRVLGPAALERLKEAAGPEAAAKLDRAPTLVVCSCALTDDEVQNEEDLHAAGIAAYIVLLGAHARGLGGYWRTPAVLRDPAGLAAVGVPEDERFVGLIHLGYAAGDKPAPERPPPDAVVTYLDRRVTSRLMLARADALSALAEEEFDVVVVGGGITGAGVALDAASRGYTVAIVERADWASGTSSRSSKMVHGGLRYLENFDLGLVREALLERQLMVELAPHLVYPTPFLVPSLGEVPKNRMLGIGLNMYDVMATTRVGSGRRERRRETALRGEGSETAPPPEQWAPDRHRTIPGEEAADLIPALTPRKPREAYLFYDCQTDDVRLVLTVLGEAERFGAVPLNGAEVVDLIEEGGRAAGVVCEETESGERFEVRAVNVVNATGVWADRLRPDEIHDEAEIPRISPSRGTHVTVSFDDLDIGRAACVVPAGEDRRIFALPWYGRTLIGTTDRDYDGDIDHVEPSGDDIDYLLAAANDFFGTAIDRSRITGAYAGVRPLISSGDPHKSVDISRKAELYETSSGLITITGGKLTTWRRMAKQVVDRLVEREGRDAPCRTGNLPLGMPAEDEDLAPPSGLDGSLPDGHRELLAFRYGHAARHVLRIAGERPELARPIAEGMPDLLAEAVIAARLEQARSVADVLLRRTRLGLLAAPRLRTAGDVMPVAEALGGELGWDEKRVAAEAERWVGEAAAEGIDPAGA